MILLNKLNKCKSFIALLQEPQTYSNRLTNRPRKATAIPHNTLQARPRAAIFASNNLKVTQLNHLCSRDCSVGLSKIGNKSTIIASVYLDIQINQNITAELEKISNYAEKEKLAVIMGIQQCA